MGGWVLVEYITAIFLLFCSYILHKHPPPVEELSVVPNCDWRDANSCAKRLDSFREAETETGSPAHQRASTASHKPELQLVRELFLWLRAGPGAAREEPGGGRVHIREHMTQKEKNTSPPVD